MDITDPRIIETAITIVGFILLRIVSNKLIDKTVKSSLMNKTRGKIIKKIAGIALLTLCIPLILLFWGVDQAELAVFVGSALAVIGIALVAQWSLLSNITAGVVIFFNHPVKLDDTVTILDKDFQIEGRVSSIGILFVILKTPAGEQISVPNNVFVQKMIKKKTND